MGGGGALQISVIQYYLLTILEPFQTITIIVCPCPQVRPNPGSNPCRSQDTVPAHVVIGKHAVVNLHSYTNFKGTVSLDNQPRCPRITIGSRGEIVVNYLIFAGIL